MKILLTNDDGVMAPGIAQLARQLAQDGHQVTVAAPASNRSGSSAALGPVSDGVLIPRAEHVLVGVPEIRALGIDGPPAMIVHAFCSGPAEFRPELVVSGINDGHNTGRAIVHSGTVGAAVAASTFGITGIAVSTGPLPQSRFDTAAIVTSAAIRALSSHHHGLLLNINVPSLPVAQIRGAMEGTISGPGLADISYRRTADGFVVNKEYWNGDLDPLSDSGLVRAGYVSASRIRSDSQSDSAVLDVLAAIQGVVGGDAQN